MTPRDHDARHRIATGPEQTDPDLKGRTYPIPFDRVWNAAARLASGGLARWRVIRADDVTGVIQAEVAPRLWEGTGDVLVRIGLDVDGQTRVDLVSSSRGDRPDLGSTRRRVLRFLRDLDHALGAVGGAVHAAPRGGATPG